MTKPWFIALLAVVATATLLWCWFGKQDAAIERAYEQTWAERLSAFTDTATLSWYARPGDRWHSRWPAMRLHDSTWPWRVGDMPLQVAHNRYPLGTVAVVRVLRTGATALVVISDRIGTDSPRSHRNRVDATYTLFKALGLDPAQGLETVELTPAVMPRKED